MSKPSVSDSATTIGCKYVTYGTKLGKMYNGRRRPQPLHSVRMPRQTCFFTAKSMTCVAGRAALSGLTIKACKV
jgi:hypothetical protein